MSKQTGPLAGVRVVEVTKYVQGPVAGMMLANLPAIFLGQRMLDRIPMNLVRYTAALLFIAFGIWGIIRAL